MTTWIFIFGLVFLYVAGHARWQRREERGTELASLQRDIRTAKFWGYGVEAADKAYKEKLTEHDSWKNNIKFELFNWAAMVIGALLCLIAAVAWLGEDQTRTWGQLWDLTWTYGTYAAVGAFLLHWVYQLIKRLDRAENEIAWLSQTLGNLGSNYRGCADHLTERVDRLEGKARR